MPSHSFKLSPADQRALTELRRRPGVSAAAKKAAGILLDLGKDGMGYRAVAKVQEVRQATVSKAVKAFKETGVLGIMDLEIPHWGRPTLPQAKRTKILALAKDKKLRLADIAKQVECSIGVVSGILHPRRRN